MRIKPRHPEADLKIALRPMRGLSARKSLGELVYGNLRQAIVRGDLAPGTRLVESRIAGAQGISRTPVREAIHKLERERFIERLPRGGFGVLAWTGRISSRPSASAACWRVMPPGWPRSITRRAT